MKRKTKEALEVLMAALLGLAIGAAYFVGYCKDFLN